MSVLQSLAASCSVRHVCSVCRRHRGGRDDTTWFVKLVITMILCSVFHEVVLQKKLSQIRLFADDAVLFSWKPLCQSEQS